MRPKKCQNCGNELNEEALFCPICGEKVDKKDEEQPSPSQEAVSYADGRKGIKKSKLLLISCVAFILIIVALGIVIITSRSFKGKYKLISSPNSNNYMTFYDDYYTYTSGTTEETGSYKLDDDRVTVIDQNGTKTVYFRNGKYLLRSDHFEEQIKDTTQHQLLSYYESAGLGAYSISILRELWLKPDGTYTNYYGLYYAGDLKSNKNEDGTYKIVKNKIILKPDTGEDTYTYIIKDGYVYYSVYMKSR